MNETLSAGSALDFMAQKPLLSGVANFKCLNFLESSVARPH